MLTAPVLLALQAAIVCQAAPSASSMDRRFEALAARFVDEFPALSPVAATAGRSIRNIAMQWGIRR